MIARHLVHIALGLVMADLFTWSVRGIGAAGFLALVSPIVTLASFQGTGFYRQLSQAGDLHRTVEERGWRDYIWSYFAKAGWYTLVTLVVAQVARSHG